MKIVTKTTVPAQPLFTLFIILLLSMLGSGNTSAQNEPYAVRTYDATNNYYKLNFYCDDQKDKRSGDKFTDMTAAEWSNDPEKPIHTVIIDSWCNYNGFKPISCARWFKGVADIDGLYNLNTSECTSMEEMFLNCTASYIDISYFDTEKVTTMKDMFKGCTGVTSLSVSDFNTSNVTDMSGMFCGCTNLSEVHVENFNTAKVTNMSSMFEGCSNLHPGHIVDLSQNSHFTTGKVTNMSNMFKGCSVNKPYSYSIDFNYFTTDQVTDFSGMFEDCKFIKRLDIHTFRFAAAETMSNMFKNCSNLTTVFVSDKLEQNELDKLNHPDLYIGSKLSTDKPFNPYGEIYITFDEPTKTLTFHYNTTIPSNGEIRYYPNGSSDWLPINSIVENAVFLDEFENAKPLSCTNWFLGCSTLKQIIGLHKLNVSDVIESTSMFEGCESIKVLDLRSFKTDQVEYMTNMFYGCESLNTILISDLWSTDGLGKDDYHPNPDLYRQHTYSRTMFFNCKQLIGYDGKYVDERCVTATNLDYNDKYQFQYAYAGEGGFMTKDNFKVFNDSLPGKWITYEGFSVQGNTITLPAAPPSNVIRHGDEFYGWAILDKEPTTETTATFSDEEVFPYGLLKIEAVYLHPYAEFDNTTSTLTFKYDTKYSHETIDNNTSFDVIYWVEGDRTGGNDPYASHGAYNYPLWNKLTDQVKNVKFDDSFNNYQLIEYALPDHNYCSCREWFLNFSSLENVDFTNFDASEVTQMDLMFAGCTSLKSVTLNINTTNVKDMSNMFYGCINLEDITFGNDFSTSNVTSMEGMFAGCLALKELDLSKFETTKVTNMSEMFTDCASLKELDLSTFNTSAVTDMFRMFHMELNISPIWNGSAYIDMNTVQNKLETIYIGEGWNTKEAIANKYNSSIEDIFNGCTKLIGGSNVKYSELGKNGINYANAKTGYLTKLPYTIKYIDADTKKELSTDLLSNGTYPDSYSSTDAKITIKPPTNKKGYVFKGWTDGLNGNTGLTTHTNEDITLDPANIKYNLVFNANWEKITYTVTFIDGTYSSSTTVDYNSTISEFPQREKEGYTLTWTIKENSTSTPFQLSTPITDNINLYAEWAVKQYAVSFENEFGEKPASQTVKYGSTITEPDTKNFIDDDNTFTGLWYTTDDFSGAAWNFATSSVFNNTTLYAKWEPIPVWTVRFINNSSTYSSAQVKDGNLVAPPSTNPSKTGHTFKSWCIYNNDGELTEYVFEQNRVDKSFDLYASFEPNQHTITYLIDDIVIDKPLTVYYGEKIAIKEVPQDKEGFNFSGWTPSSLPETMPDQDIEVNGYWLAKGQYLLTFDTDGGTPTIASQKLYVGDPITAPSTTQLTKIGYTFKEWDTEIPAIMPDSNLTIKAIWTPNQYEVRFRIVRDTIFKTVLVPFGELITKPNENPTRKGYTFNGWIMDNIPETMDVAENGYDIIADWKPIQKISVQLQSNTNHFYYPSDSAMFCNNKESGLTLSFKYDVNRPAPTHYTISFNSTEIPEQQGNITPNADNNEILVHINIPDYALSTDYTGNIVFDDGGNSLDSNPIELVLTTNIPHKSIIMYLYHDVIFIDNKSGRYDNAKYQWYKGGNPVGQNRQYYTEPVISGIYSVKIDVNGQKPIYTCPLMASTTKIAKAALKVYPNPVRSNSEFTVEIIGYTPETEYTLLVFGNNGSLVRSTTTFESSAKLSLPQGIYNIALTANGEKCGSVKIMVER